MTVCVPTDTAVVLGSAQPASDIDEAACRTAGVDVVRRRSGGGAVLVEPGSQLWVDFEIGRHDELFVNDVSASFAWVGELWASAIAALLPTDPPITVAPPTRGSLDVPYGKVVCFAAIGAGEVLLGGKKVVGISQRRDRAGARFHTMALVRTQADRLAGLLQRSDADRLAAARALRETASSLDLPAGGAGGLVAALAAHLP